MNTAKRQFTYYNISTKDISIIRQHFTTPNIIDNLRNVFPDKKVYNEVKKETAEFLDDMVKMILANPSPELMEELAKCCDKYPKCSCSQPVEKSSVTSKNKAF